MDPLWLSLFAIVTVIVGVLVLRLHPFLALSFGALLVAIFTPRDQLVDVAVKEHGNEVVRIEGAGVGTKSPTPSGRSHVYRRQHSHFREVGRAVLSVDSGVENGRTIESVEPTDLSLAVGDLLVHEADYGEVLKAPKIGAGQRFSTGFGDTCRKIGILIAMASVIGTCLLESGAARRIVDSTGRMVGERNTPLAFTISGFVVGIPVFFDTVFYLLMPLARAMRIRTGRNYLLYVMSIVIGATMAHSLVPPTPGPLLVVSAIDGVSVGQMMLGGLVVGMITVASGFLYCLWANRVWEIPLRNVAGADGESTNDDGLTTTQDADEVATDTVTREAPSLLASLTPILLPVLLLALKTFADSPTGSQSTWVDSIRPVIDFLGDKNIALVIAATIALGILWWHNHRHGSEKPFAGIQPALASGGLIILITAAGGAFGHVLRQCGIADAIQARFPATQDGMVLLLFAFAVTAIVRFAQGSATVAMITGVSIVGPLAAGIELPYHPVYLALAIGCGSKPLPWMNDSGFWIVGRMSGMTEAETLKTFSATLTIMGIVGLLVTLAGAKWFPFVGS